MKESDMLGYTPMYVKSFKSTHFLYIDTCACIDHH